MGQLTENQLHQEALYNFPYHYLDLKVEEYKLLRSIEYLSYIELVKNLLKPYNGDLILDAGCGDGRLCYELKEDNVRIVGVDFSESAIAFAKAFNPDVKFLVQDLEQLHLPYKFDYIFLVETLEHFIPEKIPVILQKLSNVLAKDGKLIVTVPSRNLPMVQRHYQHFTKESLTRILEPHFKIVTIFGYSKIGYKRNIFDNLRRVGFLLYPLRSRIKSVRRFLHFLAGYYERNLAVDDPDKCRGLIGVCEKAS
ncbi:MAG: class I SAM-dependent methyltransferase [Thermodesulfobacteriota bacterium]